MNGVSRHRETPGRVVVAELLVSLRSDQWTKNCIVFADLVFWGQFFAPIAIASERVSPLVATNLALFLLESAFGWLSIGFVLCAVAGAVVLDVPINRWLLVCILLLALFLALTKRRQVIVTLGTDSVKHRQMLGRYSPQCLDQMVAVAAAATRVSYAVYTTGAKTIDRFGTDLLTLTIPLPVYGLMRYLILPQNPLPDSGPPWSRPSSIDRSNSRPW